ncbi:MAG: hypothetical protein JO127_09140 [Caulobacteraceae bacterium]|nr:hypothetical protein [Caulobacteraceae bacterium]
MTEVKKRALRKYYYVAFKQMYEEIAEGIVKVTNPDGRTGVFQWNGKYLEGDLTQANLHMLVWTGGPPLPEAFSYHWIETPIDVNRKSGWPAPYETIVDYQIGQW